MAVMALDGDIVAYKTAAVCEEHFEGACEDLIDKTLETIATDTGITDMRIYLTGKDNFRYDVATTQPYKESRKTIIKPQYLPYCKGYLRDRYGAITMNGYEADDGIATDMKVNGAYHCGVDKDLLQCPGKHYNYVKKVWVEVSEELATLLLYRQVLTGDSGDDIPGLPGVGPKTAEKVIVDAETAFEDAVDYYIEVCAKKLPDIDARVYFYEQRELIRMVDDIDMYEVLTTTIKKRFF